MRVRGEQLNMRGRQIADAVRRTAVTNAIDLIAAPQADVRRGDDDMSCTPF